MGMTFKQFKAWCNDRACDGCWGYLEAVQCLEVGREIQRYPIWKREKMWKYHYMRSTIEEIVKQTNQLILERFGDGNGEKK